MYFSYHYLIYKRQTKSYDLKYKRDYLQISNGTAKNKIYKTIFKTLIQVKLYNNVTK